MELVRNYSKVFELGFELGIWIETKECFCRETVGFPSLHFIFYLYFEITICIWSLIVASRKLMFLKQIFAQDAKLQGKEMMKNIKFPSGNYQTDSSETWTLLALLFTTQFSSTAQFKNHIELFSTFFRLKAWKKPLKFK